jgi:LPXTG-motif cell wall-anchored protein
MVLGGVLVSSASPAAGQLSATPFTGYGSGDVIAVNALAIPGGTQLAGLRAAASGGNVNSGSNGLQSRTNEFGQNVGPANAGKNAYGRGAAVEAGLLTVNPQPVNMNQILVAGLAEAYSPPPTDLVRTAIDIDLNPVVFARTGAGEAQSRFDPVYCPVGRPITYGRGFAENLQLLGSGTNPDESLVSPVLGTSTTTGTDRATTQSRTVTYVIANGDGTFGLVSETRQTLAPIELNVLGVLGSLLIEVAGEFGLRTVATGKPGGSSVTHLGDPVLTISTVLAGTTTPVLGPITLSSLIGAGGIGIGAPLNSIINLTLGGRPRGLNQAFGTSPQTSQDGTQAAGAIDLLRVAVPLVGVDVGLFHMEGQVTVPTGGFRCTIPVSKVASADPITAGQDFTYTIRIPTDTALFDRLFNCDLLNVSAVDTVTTESGNPRIQLLGASAGGVVSGNTVTWANLGPYQRGAPPITLTINARIPSNSGAGVLRDTVNVTASLGNCQGGVTGEDIIQGNAQIPGIARLDGSAITGAVTLVGPNVSRGTLAATGSNSWPLVAGGGFMLAALGLVRLRRRAAEVPSVLS